VNPIVEEFRQAQFVYNEVSAKYTAKHPEVQAAQARLNRLKKQMPPELVAALTPPDNAAKPAADVKDATDSKDAKAAPPDSTVKDAKAADASTKTAQPSAGNRPPTNNQPPAGNMMQNPLYQKLAAQLEDVKTELAIRQREKSFVEGEIAKYSRRVEATPLAEQDISEAQRQNDELKKQYDDLKTKLSQAKLAESLESKQKGSQFIIQDPANYPLTPAKPNKPLVFLAGSLISLALSIVFAAIVDITRQRIWTQTQIEAFWGVPVLVDIPAILTDSDLAAARKKNRYFLASSIAGALAYSFCLYVVYVKHDFVLRQLDPILQQVVYK